MNKIAKIPVHSMQDWFSGLYIKQMSETKAFGPSYERSVAHRHDFYYCVLLEDGEIELEVDLEKFSLIGRTLFLSCPGQVHRIISIKDQRGWFLAFDPAILDDQIKDILDRRLPELILTKLSQERSLSLHLFIAHLYEIYNDKDELFRETITRSMVTALIYRIASTYLSAESADLVSYPVRSIEITKTFKQLLRRSFKTIKKPGEFARHMNITVSHLNDTIKSITGFSLTYHIQQENISEAKRLLDYSALTVKEIADELGFEDEKYFNRLFSKVVGMAPGVFRKISHP